MATWRRGARQEASTILRMTLQAILLVTAGCGMKTSSLLLERRARGTLAESTLIGFPMDWKLEPAPQLLEQQKVEVAVTYASKEYQRQFFSNRQLFGPYAGATPYFPENLVFYVKIANRSDKRLTFNPTDFMLVDDRGNQYSTINEDYVTALAEYHSPVATTTRGVLAEARPGYFGLSLPIGKMLTSKPQGRFALIKWSSLQGGSIYPGVTHDGLVAFWSPTKQATTLRLLITSIKTDFDADGIPKTALEFPFAFRVQNADQTPGQDEQPSQEPQPSQDQQPKQDPKK